jgi:uncharacterized protein (DUF1800 family)
MRVSVKIFVLSNCALAVLSAALLAQAQTIAVTPTGTSIAVGTSLQFAAKVTGLASTTVTWEVSNVVGGNATIGTISKTGLYKAPATLTAGQIEYSVSALGSDNKTRGSATVTVKSLGPTITSVNPSPLNPGAFTAVLHGSGFISKPSVRNGTTPLATTFINSSEISVTGAQANTAPLVLSVANPGSEWGPSFSVPFATTGAAPVIAPKTIYVHLGAGQKFTAPTATYWTASAGTMTQTGLFVAPATMPASPIVTITAVGPGGAATAKVTLAAGAVQAITPANATVAIGKTLQFTSAGAAVWSAAYGTITSTGLYTAPPTWPLGSADTVSVNGTQGNASVKVIISPPTPTITAVGNGGHIPLGVFSVVIQGANFSPGSTAEMLGIGLATSYSGGSLRISGFTGTSGTATLKVINGPVSSQPFPVNIGWPQGKASPAAARRFLEQAAFGPSPNDADHVQQWGEAAWLTEQFNSPQSSTYSGVTAQYGGMPEQFLTNAVNQPDQLRQRVAFALSQIFVTSLDVVPNKNMVLYQDMLLADAFTNYSQIMTDVTLSPAMGQYLNIANNAKANPSYGSLANENFAREMMQLFTLGTALLNPDGSVQVDSSNIPLPTYSQFQVTEFARVYTGWTYANVAGQNLIWNAQPNNFGPMLPYTAEHDNGSKQLLNGYVAPANVTPRIDLNNAIGNIFNHPNIGPFVSNLLIQHLVKSNPSPAYVARVAAVFANNGSGVRGDMKAIVTAILLDPEARENDEGGNDQPTDGHLQEPALFIAGMVRAFGGQMNDQNYWGWELQNLGQNIFAPPSVFNYYSPSYGVEGTNLLGPEFQIDSPNGAVIRANEVSNLFSSYSNSIQTFGPGTSVDLSPFLHLASNPTNLVNALDLTLTHGVMPADMKSTIVTAVAGETGGNLRQVQRAVYLILTSGYYNVWH